MISAAPELHTFKVVPGSTLFLGCDGIFDRLSNEDVAELFRMKNPELGSKTLAQVTGSVLENCLREAMLRDSYDNLSVISISF